MTRRVTDWAQVVDMRNPVVCHFGEGLCPQPNGSGHSYAGFP